MNKHTFINKCNNIIIRLTLKKISGDNRINLLINLAALMMEVTQISRRCPATRKAAVSVLQELPLVDRTYISYLKSKAKNTLTMVAMST